MLFAVTPVLSRTVDSTLPAILYSASITAPVSILFVFVVAALSIDSFHSPIPTEQPGLSRVLSVHALLVVKTNPSELDLAEIVAAVSVDNVPIITDFVL